MAMLVSIFGTMGFWMGCGGGADGGGGSDGSSGFKAQPLQGNLGGEGWKYDVGSATTLDTEDSELNVNLYRGVDNPCTVSPFDYEDWRVHANLPAEERRFENATLAENDNPEQNFTFAHDGDRDDIMLKNGFIEPTSIGEAKVTGKIYAKHDSEHYVSGEFEAIRCDTREGQELID